MLTDFARSKSLQMYGKTDKRKKATERKNRPLLFLLVNTYFSNIFIFETTHNIIQKNAWKKSNSFERNKSALKSKAFFEKGFFFIEARFYEICII